MPSSRRHYLLLWKPYGFLSQFTAEGSFQGLKSLGQFPSDVYAAGRLDAESEGLLLLTNDNRLKHFLMEPTAGHPRTYLVQVERIPTDDSLEKLRQGVVIEGTRTKPAEVRRLDHEPHIPPRPVPIRFRKNVPTVWLEIILREGRNRQIRKMTAAVGHPTLRLVRTAIGGLKMGNLKSGEWRMLDEKEIVTLKREGEKELRRMSYEG